MAAEFPTPQAMLPTWEPRVTVYNTPIPGRSQIDPPRVIALDGATTVFDARPGSALGDLKIVSKLTIQNLSANAMYIALNQDASTGIGGYHLLLPASALGAQVDLSVDQPTWVSVVGTDGDLVNVYISYPQGAQP